MNQESVISWGQEYLTQNDCEQYAAPKIVRKVPWSTVICFSTNKGLLYLKQMAAVFSIEPDLLSFLSMQGLTPVPQVLAYNKKLSCFLMQDAGTPLRDHLKKSYQIDLLCSALRSYAKIQLDCIPHINTLQALGLSDWRLEKLPTLYPQFISNETLLKSDGLTALEIEKLHRLKPTFSILCEKLSTYGIPETLEHGDFHDNNILLKDGILTINDWGDANLAHPFLSLASCLDSAQRHHALNKTQAPYKLACRAYLENWQDYGSLDQLRDAFSLADKIRYFHFCLSLSRIKACPGIENFKQYDGYIANALRMFIKTLASL